MFARASVEYKGFVEFFIGFPVVVVRAYHTFAHVGFLHCRTFLNDCSCISSGCKFRVLWSRAFGVNGFESEFAMSG